MHTSRARILIIVATLFAAEPAFAHHMMGGKMPQTFIQGLLSGLAHPVIGLDHLAALAAIGLLAALLRRGSLLIPLCSAALIFGVILHVGRLTVPAAELLAALATAAVGGLVLFRGIGVIAVTAIAAIAAVVHGYTLGESIVGAEQTPLAAYLLGLALSQAMVAACAYVWARVLLSRGNRRLIPLAGGIVAAVGAIFALVA